MARIRPPRNGPLPITQLVNKNVLNKLNQIQKELKSGRSHGKKLSKTHFDPRARAHFKRAVLHGKKITPEDIKAVQKTGVLHVDFLKDPKAVVRRYSVVAEQAKLTLPNRFIVCKQVSPPKRGAKPNLEFQKWVLEGKRVYPVEGTKFWQVRDKLGRRRAFGPGLAAAKKKS